LSATVTCISRTSPAFLVQLFAGDQLAMFLVRCAIGGLAVLLFTIALNDRRLDAVHKPAWSLRHLLSAFYVDPRRSPDVRWAFLSRLLLVLAYAFLTTYQAYYLIDRIGTSEAHVPHQIFLGTLTQAVGVIAASLIGGRISVRTGRRKVFVCAAAIVYDMAMFMIAAASSFSGFLIGMALGGSASACTWPSTSHSSRGAPRHRQRRQGPRRLQPRRRTPLHDRAGDRPGHPRHQRAQLRCPLRRGGRQRHPRRRRHPPRHTCALTPTTSRGRWPGLPRPL
jgi:hypothetical protein